MTIRTSRFLVSAVIIPLLLSACTPPVPTGPRDDCGLIEPTQEDIDKILSFGAEAFPPQDWVRSYTVEPYKMTLFRRNDAECAIAYIEYLIYTCGYGQAELDRILQRRGIQHRLRSLL